MLLNPVRCCGVREVHGISLMKPKEVITNVGTEIFTGGSSPAFMFFTSNDNELEGKSYGAQLADYIEEKKLGTVFRSKIRNNPNTDASLRMFLWEADIDKLKEMGSKIVGEAWEKLGLEVGTCVKLKNHVFCNNMFLGNAIITNIGKRNISLKREDGVNGGGMGGGWIFNRSDCKHLEKITKFSLIKKAVTNAVDQLRS